MSLIKHLDLKDPGVPIKYINIQNLVLYPLVSKHSVEITL